MTDTAETRIGLLSNPNSGHNRDNLAEISRLVKACPTVHHIVTDSVADIGPALDELARREVDVLAINGGDGTGSAILGQVLQGERFPTPPRVIWLPGGTANMNAGDVGVDGKLLKAVKRFCDWSHGLPETEARPVQRVLLEVRVHPGARPAYGMFLGGGAVMQGTEYAHAEIHARGLRDDFSLALGMIRTLWGVFRDDPEFNRHVAIEVTLDGREESTSHDTLILAISSLQHLFMGMRPFWGEGPGPLRLTLIQQHAYHFLRTFATIARGAPNRNAVPGKGYFSHNAGRISLSLDGSLNLDGEILEASIEAGPVVITPTAPLTFLRL